jgi:hypothetical protein
MSDSAPTFILDRPVIVKTDPTALYTQRGTAIANGEVPPVPAKSPKQVRAENAAAYGD